MRGIVAAAVIVSGLGMTPATAACGADPACLAAESEGTEAAVSAVRVGSVAAIATWDGNLSDADRTEWAARLEAETAAWDRWRTLRCTGDGADRAATLACRIRLARVLAADLAARYGLGYGAFRLDLETPSDPDAAADGDEFGPCSEAPPGDCDYCGINACFEGLQAEADRKLEEALAGALRRADKAGRMALVAEQAAWADWRDLACENAAWETPNRWAHSITALTIAPCRLAEAEGRIRRLRGTTERGP